MTTHTVILFINGVIIILSAESSRWTNKYPELVYRCTINYPSPRGASVGSVGGDFDSPLEALQAGFAAVFNEQYPPEEAEDASREAGQPE